MRARRKVSWEDALRSYFRGMIFEDAWGEVPVARCLTKGDRRRCLGKDALAKVL
jgi:hypothetical protein